MKPYSDKRPAQGRALQFRAQGVDARNMHFLFSNRPASWSRVAMDASGIAFAFSLIALAAQSA